MMYNINKMIEHDLVQPFQRFGYIQEVKFHADRGFAFVK